MQLKRGIDAVWFVAFTNKGFKEYKQASDEAKRSALKKLTEDERKEIIALIKQNPKDAKITYNGMDAYLLQAPPTNLTRRQLSNSVCINMLHKSAVWISCIFLDPVTAETVQEGVYYIAFGKFKENEKEGVKYQNMNVHDIYPLF